MVILFDIISWVSLVLGGFFCIVGAIGLLRFPDFYTRLHAAGVTDTLGADFILLAMALQSNDWITIAKLFLIFVFILLTSPVATHAIAARTANQRNRFMARQLKTAQSKQRNQATNMQTICGWVKTTVNRTRLFKMIG